DGTSPSQARAHFPSPRWGEGQGEGGAATGNCLQALTRRFGLTPDQVRGRLSLNSPAAILRAVSIGICGMFLNRSRWSLPPARHRAQYARACYRPVEGSAVLKPARSHPFLEEYSTSESQS